MDRSLSPGGIAAAAGGAESAALRHPFPEPPAPGAGAVEVAPGVLWMRLPLPFRPDHVNVYALDDGADWTIVDTGIGDAASRAAWAALLQGPLGGRRVARVLLTHHHPDHVGLAGWFRQAHGAEIVASRTAWLLTRMLQLDLQERPAPEALAFWRAAGMPAEMLTRRAAERPFNFADCTAALPLGFTRLREGDRFAAGGRLWEVVAGEGHAPEHLTLWSVADGLVIGGDQLLPGISANLGVHPTEPGADPVGDWLASCARLAPRAREDQLVLPGHRLPYLGLPGRLTEMVAGVEAALARLLAHLAEPRVAADCFLPLYGREIGGELYGLALAEAVGHLNHLLARGLVRREPGPEGAWLWQRA